MKNLIFIFLFSSSTLFAQKQDAAYNDPPYNISDWFYNTTSLVSYLGVDNHENSDNVGFRTITDYRFDPHFGLGLGAEYARFNFLNASFIPLFIDPRIFVPLHKITNSFAFDAGYTIGLNSAYSGGLLFEVNYSLSIPISKISDLTISLGYRIEEYSYNTLNRITYFNTATNLVASYYYTTSFTNSLNVVDIGCGVTF